MTPYRREPDYMMRAQVAADGETVDAVPLLVYLPEVPAEPVRLTLRPSMAGARRIGTWFKGNISAKQPLRMDGSGSVEVASTHLYFRGVRTTTWGPNLHVSEARCEPVTLRVTELHTPDAPPGRTRAVFWLTPNRHLSPGGIHEVSYDGSSTVKRIHRDEVPLTDGLTLSFDRHYSWIKRPRGEESRRSFLVAEVEGEFPAHDPAVVEQRLGSELDDLLLVVSAGSSTRTTCVGWQCADGRGITRYYRRSTGVPKGKPYLAMDVGLVPLHEFTPFLTQAWPAFTVSPYREAIRALVYALAPVHVGTFEAAFLRMFSALEETLLAYRRSKGTEFVLPRHEWRSLEDSVKKVIRGWESGRLTAEQRSHLYDNLGGVNRIALRRVFESFVTDFRLDLTDLWPVFSNDATGLANLRNKIVHGDFPERAVLGSITVAQDHLYWTLQRIFLALLAWPAARSEVSPSFLRRIAASMRDRDQAIQEVRPLLAKTR